MSIKTYECPTCHAFEFNYIRPHYCSNCGRKGKLRRIIGWFIG
jgi:hypothetical protein